VRLPITPAYRLTPRQAFFPRAERERRRKPCDFFASSLLVANAQKSGFTRWQLGQERDLAPCPQPSRVMRFLRHDLRAADEAQFEAHVDVCPACCALLADLARLWALEDDSLYSPE